jgi:hypothetical protein
MVLNEINATQNLSIVWLKNKNDWIVFGMDKNHPHAIVG